MLPLPDGVLNESNFRRCFVTVGYGDESISNYERLISRAIGRRARLRLSLIHIQRNIITTVVAYHYRHHRHNDHHVFCEKKGTQHFLG